METQTDEKFLDCFSWEAMMCFLYIYEQISKQWNHSFENEIVVTTRLSLKSYIDRDEVISISAWVVSNFNTEGSADIKWVTAWIVVYSGFLDFWGSLLQGIP